MHLHTDIRKTRNTNVSSANSLKLINQYNTIALCFLKVVKNRKRNNNLKMRLTGTNSVVLTVASFVWTSGMNGTDRWHVQ